MYQQDGQTTDLKYSKKIKTGPFIYQTPLQEYISELDEEMGKVLNSQIPSEDKMKLYLNLLVKYKQKYDITKLNDSEIIVSEVKSAAENNTKNLINEIKAEFLSNEEKTKTQINDFKNDLSEEKAETYASLTDINTQLKSITDENKLINKLRKQALNKKNIQKSEQKEELKEESKEEQKEEQQKEEQQKEDKEKESIDKKLTKRKL